ncbi:DNA-binding SARP family transcriptional activator [Umezawaea tangerina]|uniref:DNA-binding SARP family transcriptional activator n=1 Tax=Umezawaea tangerina TaxID=84725 RepID=A0A2T0TGD0_9PSEU|nr:DNA-binding SARP family transcriptional activator [Umezawaea tangerina]
MLFRVLGPLETGAEPRRWGARKPAALLAALLLDAGEWVSCDRLVDVVWSDRTPPASAESNVKTYVWQIRKSLCDSGTRIEGRPGAYRVRVAAGELDVDCFKERARLARRAMADGDPARAVDHLTAALELWRGRPFAELTGAVAAPVVAELDELRWEVRETLADGLTALGRLREAVALLRELTAADPLREGPWTRLVRVLLHDGRRGEALAAYERARTAIAEELGVDPGRDLVQAHRLALGEDQPRRAARRDLPRAVPDFTGRADEVARVVRLSRTSATCVPVVVVEGPAGIGKTAFAVHAAHRIAEAFPDGQLYVDLRGADLLVRLLHRLGVHDVPADPEDRAAAWRAELAGRRLLLVLDGATSAEQVEPLLPGSPGCMVLVTAESRLHLDAVETVTLAPLSAAESATLFRTGAPDAPDDVVREVTRFAHGVPAAVRKALEDGPQRTGVAPLSQALRLSRPA